MIVHRITQIKLSTDIALNYQLQYIGIIATEIPIELVIAKRKQN